MFALLILSYAVAHITSPTQLCFDLSLLVLFVCNLYINASFLSLHAYIGARTLWTLMDILRIDGDDLAIRPEDVGGRAAIVVSLTRDHCMRRVGGIIACGMLNRNWAGN